MMREEKSVAVYEPPIGAPPVDTDRCREAVTGHFNVQHQCTRRAREPREAPQWCRYHSPSAKARRAESRRLKTRVDVAAVALRDRLIALGAAYLDNPRELDIEAAHARRAREIYSAAIRAYERLDDS